jgi:ribose/xylose/arabinose/galactoside ABC-type transport system permease subunit
MAASPSALWPTRIRPTSDLVRRYGVWLALLAVITFGIVAVPDFATPNNADSLIRQSAILGVASVGTALVIIAGGLDLSIGALMGAVTVMANGIMNGDASLIPTVVAIAIGLGLVVGSVNGLGIVVTRVYPLIFTLGTLSIVQGAIYVYTDRSIGTSPPEFLQLSAGSIGPIPIPLIVVASSVALGWVILEKTSLGRHLRAVGSDPEVARKSGIRVNRVRVISYLASSMSGVLAGLLLASRLGTGFPNAAGDFSLTAVVAVIVGGTALSGGEGSVLGAMAGVLLLTIIGNELNLIGMSPYLQLVLRGAIIIIAIAAYRPTLRDE